MRTTPRTPASHKDARGQAVAPPRSTSQTISRAPWRLRGRTLRDRTDSCARIAAAGMLLLLRGIEAALSLASLHSPWASEVARHMPSTGWHAHALPSVIRPEILFRAGRRAPAVAVGRSG